jgi:hypothetical protein
MLLMGMLAGAALAATSSGFAALWFAANEEPQYLRVIDDDFDHILGPDYKAEEGPTSVNLIRNCRIESFVTDVGQLDHAGSSFVRLDATPWPKLNCLIGEARMRDMSIAIVHGVDNTTVDCLGGWPTRFKEREAGDFALCVGGKNPNPIFVPTPPPNR